MNALDGFRHSNAWSEIYYLPLVPIHNNPWIYMAYAYKIIGTIPIAEVLNYYDKCSSGVKGLINRWPFGDGGVTSHDELTGLCYLLRGTKAPMDVFNYIVIHDGIYCNKPNEFDNLERFNLYRFPYFMPHVKACAGVRLSLFSQVQYAAVLLWDALTFKKTDGGGRLLLWITFDAMKEFPLVNLAINVWKYRMKKAGLSPKYIFQNLYLTECPVFGKYAPEEF